MKRLLKGFVGLSLVAMPLMQAENVSAGDQAQAIEHVRNEKEQKEADLNKEAEKINQLLDNIDRVLAEINNLETDMNETMSQIEQTEAALAEQKELVNERAGQVRDQLRTIQTSEIGRNVLYTFFESKNLGDAIGRALSIYQLTDANAQNLLEAQADVNQLEELREELVAAQSELAGQKEKTAEQKEDLDKHIVLVQETLNKHQDELTSISNHEDKLVAQLEEKKNEAEAAKAKEESGKVQEQQVTTASSTVASAPAKQESAPTPAPAAPAQNEAPAASQPASGWMTFQSTGYSTQEAGLSAYTATGINLLQNPRVIAVDPSIIPLGSVVEVQGMGTYIAGDTGGAINGHIIDIHFPTLNGALSWGRRTVNIRILN